MEIERKFLVDHHPELADAEPTTIEQGYLSLATGGAEVRLRRRGEAAADGQAGAGRARDEEEIELDREQFDALWRLTEGRRLTKTRYVIPHGELEIELDVYAGELEGLMIAEVEFPDERDCGRLRGAGVVRRRGDRETGVPERNAGNEGASAMTAFKLKKKESARDGIRRVAHGRAEDAVRLLRDEGADPVEAVHESRKDMKKLRATLKLVRPVLGERGLLARERPLPGRRAGRSRTSATHRCAPRPSMRSPSVRRRAAAGRLVGGRGPSSP